MFYHSLGVTLSGACRELFVFQVVIANGPEINQQLLSREKNVLYGTSHYIKTYEIYVLSLSLEVQY